jgi:hypothetical protein
MVPRRHAAARRRVSPLRSSPRPSVVRDVEAAQTDNSSSRLWGFRRKKATHQQNRTCIQKCDHERQRCLEALRPEADPRSLGAIREEQHHNSQYHDTDRKQGWCTDCPRRQWTRNVFCLSNILTGQPLEDDRHLPEQHRYNNLKAVGNVALFKRNKVSSPKQQNDACCRHRCNKEIKGQPLPCVIQCHTSFPLRKETNAVDDPRVQFAAHFAQCPRYDFNQLIFV